MSVPAIGQLLASTLSANASERATATEQLAQFSASSLPDYLQALSAELANPASPPHIRNAAGLAIKNSLTSRDSATKDEYAARWLSCPEPVRLSVKQTALASLSVPDRAVRNVAAQVVAAIAALELPANAWPSLVADLLSLSTQEGNAHLRQAALQTIGFICESISPTVLAAQSNQILTAVVQSVRKEEPDHDVRLAAITALTNSLEFIRANFEREGERNYIMQVVCEATQASFSDLQVAAFECLVRIMQLFYDKMRFYMEQALFGLTVLGMKHDDEHVVLQAIEFWSTVCDEEIDLAVQAQEAAEYEEPVERESQHFARIALPEILPVLLQLLTKQEDDADENEWNTSMAAGTCLSLLAQAVGDGIVTPIIPFVETYISNPDWHYREAAVMAFGSIINGPEPALLRPLVGQALPTLISMMQDQDPHVRDTTAWALARICDTLIRVIDPAAHLGPLVSALVSGLSESPRIAGSCCWGLMNLAEQLGDPDAASSPLSGYYDTVSGALLAVTERIPADAATRTAAFEALSAWASQAPTDALAPVSRLVLTTLERMERLQQTQGQLLGMDERNEYNELQSNLCGLLTATIRRLDKDVVPLADRIMTILLRLIQSSGTKSTVLEDALMCIGATASALDQNFQQYADAFLPFLASALSSYQEYQLCSVAVGLVADVARALGSGFASYCQGFMEALLAALQSQVLHRSVKPAILGCFGDVALAIGGSFEPFIATTMSVLQQAGAMQADPTDLDMVDYITQLREGILEGMTGIVSSLKASHKASLLVDHVAGIFAFLQMALSDQDRTESIIKLSVGLIGDLAEALPQGQIKAQLQKDWVNEAIKVARTRLGPEGKATGKWAREKRFYRQRAHANPFSDHALAYPHNPKEFDTSAMFPGLGNKNVEFADVGCGFGGLLFALAPKFPDTLILGMELRVQVQQYVADKIRSKRVEAQGHHYNNVNVVRANAMKFLPNHFRKHQLSKLFILFPDPHFKSRKHKARIVTSTLAAEYAFVLRPSGRLYIITDVEPLFDWMRGHLANCPLFKEATEEEQAADEVLDTVKNATEESQKVKREGRQAWSTIFIRV